MPSLLRILIFIRIFYQTVTNIATTTTSTTTTENFEGEFWEVDNGKIWAVLVSGSNGWSNYRHQSDVCHAYHLLRDKGIPESQIITFIYDDIAYNPRNPYPGKLFNDYTHTDYYEGVKIDYSGESITVERFIQVLLGNNELASAGYKVLKSGSEDNVFLYLVDHGAPGIFNFPNTESLTDIQLNETLTKMYNNGRYNKLLLYMGACFSGSMFYGILSPSIKVMAVTSANHNELSWGAFCHDPELNTCLADAFSYCWIEDSETHDITSRTVAEQFRTVKDSVQKSHPEQYGYLNLGSLELSNFQGQNPSNKLRNRTKSQQAMDYISASDIHIFSALQIMMNKKSYDQNIMNYKLLMRLINLRSLIRRTTKVISNFVKTHEPNTTIPEMDKILSCQHEVVQAFSINCFSVHQTNDAASAIQQLTAFCSDGYNSDVIIKGIMTACE
ncbi:unnamed protein product [Heterobilharzia americana]|nr:unnamed protein product [Heterobilharzia americana]CAH8462910.1 unnamed protein product [Heterobilharzia americana]